MPTPKSPYDHLDEDRKSKVQAMVSTEDKLFLQSIYPERGILLFAVESLLHSLVSDLRKHGITHYSPDNAKHVISLIRLRTDPKLTDGGYLETSTGSVEGVCSTAQDIKVITAHVHESSPGRVGRSGGKGTNEGKKAQGSSQKHRG